MPLLVIAVLPALRATTTPPAGVLPSGPPAWWAARGIADILAGSATASVTEAQLYQVALAAQAELEAKLPNGAGANITAEVAGWLNAPVPGLHAEYFPNLTLTGTPALAQQESPDHDWGWNQAPGIAGLQAGQFSVRWSGQLEVSANGNYLFEADGAGGVRLWVNGALAVDAWDIDPDHPNDVNGGRVSVLLAAGVPADIRLEYRAAPQLAQVHLRWSQQPTTFRSPGVVLHAEYFDSPDFTGEPVVERDEVADFRWGAQAPDPALMPGQFSARWTGTFVVRPDQLGPGSYPETGPVWVDFNALNQLAALSDGQVQIWIDGELMLDAAHPGFNAAGSPDWAGVFGTPVPFNNGYPHTIEIDYVASGGANTFLHWGPVPVDYFLAGLQHEAVSDYAKAVTSYQKALTSHAAHVPARAIAPRLAAIKSARPDEFAAGTARAAAPELNATVEELLRVYEIAALQPQSDAYAVRAGMPPGAGVYPGAGRGSISPRGLNGRVLSYGGGGARGRGGARGPVVSERNLPPEELAFLGRIFAGRQISAGPGFSSGGGPLPAFPSTSLVSPPGAAAVEETLGSAANGTASVPPAAAALIQRNLRQLLGAARRHFVAYTGANEVTGAQLMADPANAHLRELAVLAGEDYAKLVIRRATTAISIATASGGTVTLSP